MVATATREHELPDPQAILDLLPHGVFVVSRDWRVVYANREADRMLGGSSASLWERCPALEHRFRRAEGLLDYPDNFAHAERFPRGDVEYREAVASPAGTNERLDQIVDMDEIALWSQAVEANFRLRSDLTQDERHQESIVLPGPVDIERSHDSDRQRELLEVRAASLLRQVL